MLQLKGLEVISTLTNCVPRRLCALAIGLLLGGSGSIALADTLTYGNDSTGNLGITLKFATNGTHTTWDNRNVSAGSLTGTLSPGGSSFTMYCIDPLTWAAQGQVVVTPSPNLSSFLTGGSPNYTTQFAQGPYQTVAPGGYDDQLATTVNSRLTELYKYAYADSLMSDVKGTAFQYAIWESLGEVSLDRTSGGLQLGGGSAAINSQVDVYLNALTSHSWGSLTAINDYQFTVYIPNPQSSSQAFLSVTRGGQTGGNVPEPATAALALIGLLAAGRGVRQRRRQVTNQ